MWRRRLRPSADSAGGRRGRRAAAASTAAECLERLMAEAPRPCDGGLDPGPGAPPASRPQTTPETKGPSMLLQPTRRRSTDDDAPVLRTSDRRGKLVVVGYDDSPQARDAA